MRALVVLLLLSSSASAHQAASGWAYPNDCCAEKDCFEFPGERIKETPQGYLLPSGLLVPYDDKRLRPSPDGKYHACTFVGSLRCLFVPTPAT